MEVIGEDKIKKGGIEKKKKSYKKYNQAISRINLVGWIKEEIAKRPDRTIVVKIYDVAKEMGPEFEKIDYVALYQALKVILFQNGIFLNMATHKDGDKAFILRDVKQGDELAQSYLFTKIRQKKVIRESQSSQSLSLQMEEKEKSSIQEKKKKEDIKNKKEEDDEKSTLYQEIRKLREILNGRLGKKSCMVEIFQFNWNTLTWKMKRRSAVKTYLKLLEIIMSNTSNSENRYRIEITPLNELENLENIEIEKEDNEKGHKPPLDNEKGHNSHSELGGKEEVLEGKAGATLICPRCGSSNIKTWQTVQIIKTRSGDRKLRHRCQDCNETFTDEDLGA